MSLPMTGGRTAERGDKTNLDRIPARAGFARESCRPARPECVLIFVSLSFIIQPVNRTATRAPRERGVLTGMPPF